MGLLSSRLGIRALSLEDPSQPLLPTSALFESLGLGRSDAGVLINEQQAMRITTAHSCVKIISEDLSSTAHDILQGHIDGSMQRARTHRLWSVIHDQPNPYMTSMVFWGAVLASALGWGNGYAWVKRDNAYRVISLIPLQSGKTAPVRIGGQLMYATTQTDSGAVAYLEPDDVLHVMGLTFDGVTGLSPIQTCKNAYGLAAAAEKFGAQFFGQGARATGVLTYPGQLEDEAYENLKKSLRDRMSGDNALTPFILEEGMDWKQITIAPNDAQFIATRQFQKAEIAQMFRVPMHLLQDLTRSTNNNIEHQSLDYVRYCLRPWAVRLEQEVNRKLLGGPFTMEHDFNDLQRGDFASQTSGIQVLRNIGYYSNNDIARALRQNPTSVEEGGDLRIVQGAMIPLKSLLSYAPDSGDGGDTANSDVPDGSQPFDRIYRNLFRDAVGRVMSRAGGERPEFARRAVQPAIQSMTQALLARRFGNCELTRREQALIEQQAGLVAAESPSWEKAQAAAIATRLAVQVFRSLSWEILNNEN